MLYSVLYMMKSAFPEAQFVMAPTVTKGAAPYAKRAELGFLQKAWLWRYGVQWGDLAALAPSKVREMYGVVLDRDVDVVLDASGFAYSDQWGEDPCRELARACRRWRKHGTKIILLPQAFGPFKSAQNRKWIASAVELADLIFPREPISYRYLTEAVGERDNIRMAPDFTNLVSGVLPEDFDAKNNRFCLVPNYRMIDKTQKAESEAYVPFMADCARYLVEKGAKPFLLVHEGANDLMLAEKIRATANHPIPIIQEQHPLRIKGILGACDGTLGSRFHGLVSALSQGVPSLGTGWSHKYRMLFKDYGFEEGLIDVQVEQNVLREKIDLVTDAKSSQQIRAELVRQTVELNKRSLQMWSKVFRVVEPAPIQNEQNKSS